MTIYRSELPDIEITGKSITERIFEAIQPDSEILFDGETGAALTGTDFMNQVKSLAGGLTAHGHGAGKCAAILAPNVPEYAVIFHGICWAGGTVTTINPTYTAEEVNHQLTDANADILFTTPMFADLAKDAIRGTGVSEIVVTGDAPETTPLSALMGDPQSEQAPVDVANHVAVLPYSSGTTGLPKGVMLTHQNMVANVDQILAMADLRRGERMVAFLPFFHIYGLQVALNSYFAAGGAVVTMPRFDLPTFLKLCVEHQTGRLWIVPPVALALAMHPMIDDFDLSFVEQVNSAAAPLGAGVSTALAARLNTVTTQAYGMTELSPASHATPLSRAKPGASGMTLPSTECRIVDPETLADLPPGEDGELLIRGPQVMKGYLNRPDATAETMTGDGWLRTGDIAHFDEDGHLFITDRLKELIKYKAFQVAPAEVEAQLLAHPAISDAAVIGKPDAEAGEVPMAFIVVAPDHPAPDLSDVQAFLDPHLAHYKQVRALEVVDEVPKSASGKILRRFLRDRLTG